ncbi:NPR2 [Candida pseudojiufengensis]|uniref:NPR2 n=1 Tax=Candida pseudojiufengensis TaxID=497109 RepID=UPI002224632B|nr:NPR2 [Candida pseudojiufengensis]KAI5966575.1 NPR2 [Candida pseudojiufengensis]
MSDGFIPIVAIFYAVFHPTEGTKIVHQYPNNSIKTASSNKNPNKNDQDDNDKTNDNEDDDEDEEDEGLFNFDTVKNYIIPKPQLCNQLISFKINKFKVIGYPINMKNEHYARNSFSFNFCFVFNYEIGDVTPYESAIKRMGQMFHVLEEQNFLLSKLDKDNSFINKNSKRSTDKSLNDMNKIDLEMYTTNLDNIEQEIIENDASVNAPGHSKTKQITLSSIESLIQQIYQDLNNYSECCIPLDTSNSVDIKLFPILPAPINLKAFQVPIATVKLKSLVDVNWDPTMIKILPYIDGINSVKRISELADANYLLVKQCIQHLMHYKCIELVDIFQFNNIYAPTNHIGDFLKNDGKMAEQCQAYVVTNNNNNEYSSNPMSSFNNTPLINNSPKPIIENSTSPTFNFRKYSSSISPYSKQNYLTNSNNNNTNSKLNYSNIKVPTKTSLFYLYRSLNQGQTIKEWYNQHKNLLINIDIRRFINFGVLRGIIYRIYSYPILNSITRAIESGDILKNNHVLNNLKRKKELLKLSNKSTTNERNTNLLKTKVHEQTLKTRRVSFNYENVENNSNSKKLNTMNEVILENDSDDTEDDEDEDEYEEEETKGAIKIVPLTERKSRNSSTSYRNIEELNNSPPQQDKILKEKEEENEELKQEQDMIYLIKMLKGFQHFDSICTELQKSRSEVESMIENLGSYGVINC